ncbi:MAG: hypothetical protein DRO01_02320 [Thermoproteota archaeon]|nr:MAG: hypothetical protein DRO01_02320 [Candidatus Korarchaeota archaeon]
MRRQVRVRLEGEEVSVDASMRISELMRELGYHPEAHVPVVNGSPAPERMYLSDGDDVRFVRITVHHPGV